MTALLFALAFITGEVTTETHLEGTWAAPVVAMTVSGEAISVADLPPAKVRLTLRRALGGREVRFEGAGEGGPCASFTVRGSASLRPGWGFELDRTAPVEMNLMAQGLDLEVFGRYLPALPLSGRADVTATMTGPPEAPEASLALEGAQGRMQWRGVALDETRLGLLLGPQRTKLEVRFGPSASPWWTAAADLPLVLEPTRSTVRWDATETHTLSARGRGLTPARLRPFWRAPAAADFSLDLDVTGEGHLERFFADAVLRGTLNDGARSPIRVTATARVEPQRQAATLRLGRDALWATAEVRAPLPAIARGERLPAEAVIRGSLLAAMPLQTLAPYLPAVLDRPQGRLDADVRLDGTLAQPAFHGQVRLDGAATTLPSLLLRLTRIDAVVELAGQVATLKAFRARAGSTGGVSASARAVWRGLPATAPGTRDVLADWGLSGEGRLVARDVPFVQPEIPLGLLSSRMEARFEARPGGSDTQVVLYETRLVTSGEHLPPARAIPRNLGVRNRDWLARVQPAESPLAGEGHLGLVVELATPVEIEGDDTALRLAGRMALARDGALVKVDGGFDVMAGRFVLFKNPFTLRGGRFTLQSGDLEAHGGLDTRAAGVGDVRLHDPSRPPEAVPLEPVVSLVANGYVVDTDVTVAVRGPVRQPQLVLRSNPPLAEYQILTLLVTGRANALDDSNGDVRREAGQLVDRFHNPSLERQLYDRLGVDKLGVAFGDAVDQPILTVGRQINRELYLETTYHHNAPPTDNERELRVEYQLTPRWSVDTAYGDAAVGNVGLAWKARFGGQPPAQPLSSLGAEVEVPPAAPPSAP